MTIQLRGHHLLCLLGYRGMGYSPDFCTNMTAIYELLRMNPKTEVEIVLGPDDICQAYPLDKENHCNGTVYSLDETVLAKLGLTPGDRASWQQICDRVSENIEPADITHMCVNCPWVSYGVCQEGVQLIHEGRPLPAIESSN